VALLGVLKAGGAYVPMDPSYPADRLAMIIEDSEVRGRGRRPLVDGRMRGPVSSKVASARRHLCC